MPVKNAGPFLDDCILSIINQSYSNWELIAVNDHSTDNSPEILKNYAVQDERIKTLDNKGIGIIEAMRMAFKNSSGDFISRMDADDKMSSEKIELLSQKLLEKGAGNLAVGLVKYFSDGNLGNGYLKYEKWLNTLTAEETNYNEIYKECVIPSPNWMLFRGDLLSCGAFDHDIYPEDYDLCFRMRKANLEVASVNNTTHYWRDHPNRFSRNDANYQDNRFIDLKCKYFFSEDYNPDCSFVLWGVGNKGKSIAKLIIAKGYSFHWISNNPKKIGHDIYGVKIQSDIILTELNEPQIIIAIAAKDAQALIKEKLSKLNTTTYFYFC